MPKRLRLRVATPDNVKFDDDIEMVIMRCITGDMGILANHEAASAILDYGVLRILDEGTPERRMAVYGGIAQVKDNIVYIMANDAQWPEDIERSALNAEREELERRAQEELDDLELRKQQILMRRILVQTEVSDYPILSKVERSDMNSSQ